MQNTRKTLTLKQPKPWNHQDELRSLRGKMIKIELADGRDLSGRLAEADAYTIKVEQVTISGSVISFAVYNKSSVTSFAPA